MTDTDPQVHTGGAKGFSFYENFDGRHHKLNEIRDLIPQFKAFYYAEKRLNPTKSAVTIINAFNSQISPFTFFPWEKQYKLWRKKWDGELLAEQNYKIETRKMRQVIKMRNEHDVELVPANEALEAGARTLGGELLNDAMNILTKDQENEDAYEDDIIVKRRAYVLNVYNYVTKTVHGKESLRLKSNADKRESSGFLMDLLHRATAGNMTEDELELLKQSVPQDTQSHESNQ